MPQGDSRPYMAVAFELACFLHIEKLMIKPYRKAFHLLKQRCGRTLLITWPLVLVIAFLVFLTLQSMEILSACRAFVGGEGLWSKAQKDSVYFVLQYAQSHNAADYQKFLDSLAVPIGFRKARLELEKSEPDLEIVRQGFLVSGNHPDDLEGVVKLIRRFGHLSFMRPAFAAWVQGEDYIEELQETGEQLHDAIILDETDPKEIERLLAKVHSINETLEPLEREFSSILGEVSRNTQQFLLTLVLSITAILFSAGMGVSWRTVLNNEQFETALFEEKERAHVTLESIGDAVIRTDAEGRVEYLNPLAEQLTGWSLSEAQRLPLVQVFRILDEESREIMPDPIGMVTKENRPVKFSDGTLLIRRDGTEFSIDEMAAPIRDPEGKITGLVVVFRDVTGERKIAAQLSYQASHDALTGLVNRRELENRLAFAFEAAKTFNRHHALLCLDLDQFKLVNDTCGHPAGDQLLRQLSELLRSRLRSGDTLARLGGDEFGVLLENCLPGPAAHIAEDLLKTVSEFRFSWNNKTFRVGVSIGLVTFCDREFTLAGILQAADAAMYMAKEAGRNRIHVYHPHDGELLLRRGEMEWVGSIQEALEQNRFCLYAQEIIRLSDANERGAHFELLLRMVDTHGNLVPPMAFIPAAERYNMMPALDRWVIRAALASYARQREKGRAAFIKSWIINLSGESLVDERFFDYIKEQLKAYQVPPRVICFEITETAAIANLSKAQQFMRELRSLGCRFSLDDFGSGMSSFAYLKHLPVDFLKIDGSFVKDSAHDPIDRAMVEAINNIGHVMGLQTIAEHVEDQSTLQTLRQLGVDFAQGYGIAKPRPFDLVTGPLKAAYG